MKPVSYGFIFVLGFLCLSTYADEAEIKPVLTARQIMEASNEVDTGDNAVQDIMMTVIGKGGSERPHDIATFRKKTGANGKDLESVLFFRSPAKDRNIALLAYDYDDSRLADKQWMYLPSIRKTKQLAGKTKSSAFMSSDFSYADLAIRDPDNYSYKLLREEVLNNQKVWVIEGKPVNDDELDETGYLRSVIYIRQDNFIAIRSENDLKRGNRKKIMDVTQLEQIDGIWVPMELVMKTYKTDVFLGKTVMRTTSIKFNQNLSNHLFSKASIEHGL